jgi:hypothetical protein
MGSITVGFARALQPNEAATITKGLISEHVDDQIPEFKRYLKEKTPALIAQVPGYIKKQLPEYRANLESQLESNLDHYAEQSSTQLGDRFDTFLTANQASVKGLIDNGNDPKALATFDSNLKAMFKDYLTNTQINGETLQSKIDQTLDGLTQVDTRMKRLAANKNLTDEEKKTRKVIATLLKSVDTNPEIAQARTAVASIRQESPAQVQAAVQGVLKYTGPDEATFQEPGKPPVTFVRKKDAPASAVKAAPVAPAPPKPSAPTPPKGK